MATATVTRVSPPSTPPPPPPPTDFTVTLQLTVEEAVIVREAVYEFYQEGNDPSLVRRETRRRCSDISGELRAQGVTFPQGKGASVTDACIAVATEQSVKLMRDLT